MVDPVVWLRFRRESWPYALNLFAKMGRAQALRSSTFFGQNLKPFLLAYFETESSLIKSLHLFIKEILTTCLYW